MSKSFLFIILLSSLIFYSIQVDHCLETSGGICISCELGYYLSNNLCKDAYLTPAFHNCKETNNGISCTACNDGYFFSKNGECVNTQNCKKSHKRLSFCEECDEGFYLSSNGLFCSSSPNCIYGDIETGKCLDCKDGFYLDLNDNQCKSNQENDKFKNCKKGGEKCDECIYKYYLGEDGLCSLSKDCANSDQEGRCLKCSEGFFLSSYDNKCTMIENCLKADINFQCKECEKFLLLNNSNSECKQVKEWDYSVLLNCKNTDETGIRCNECKKNYFLNMKNNLCVLNKYMKKFKNCAKSDETGEFCELCEDTYYLGSEDKLCTSTIGCAFSENGICKKCGYSFCLNGKNVCIPNDKYEENSIYYKCQKTNSLNTECIFCEDGFILQNGKCLDTLNCKERPNGNCVKCRKNYCLNSLHGCSNINIDHCVRCDNDDLSKCTGCEAGYRLDEEKNVCVRCKEGCSTCSDDNNCGSCEKGYFVKKMETRNGAYDAECGKCKEGCKDCGDENSCISCKEGYFIVKGNDNDENLVCGECPEGCVECNGHLNCIKCDEGYYLAASGHSTFCLKVNQN